MAPRRSAPPRRADIDRCPQCGASMNDSRAPLRLPVNGEEITVRGLAHLRCPKCDERLLDLQNAQRLSEEAVAGYRRKHRLLSGREIRAIRGRFHLTQGKLARLLQLGPNTLSRWESDRKAQTAAMDTLLRLLRDVPGNLAYLQRRGSAA